MTTLQEKISRLPELPVEAFEVAGKLGFSKKVPVVTIQPHKFPAPAKPPDPTPLIPKPEAQQLTYFPQVTYLLVICQEPPRVQFDVATLFDEEGNGGSDVPESDVATIARKERFYKLTTLNGVKLPTPFWCSVHYGPWLAMAIEQESCIVGEPNLWQLSIFGIPEVSLSWYGHWEDIPPYLSLQVIGNLVLKGFTRTCCAGYNWCVHIQCLVYSLQFPARTPCRCNCGSTFSCLL